ncbi:MAG: hypothetical protein GY697_26240, partial [Desulfobacterales bacterium]|nr:hypothetical protein [Desulfobacterales bacterium]
MAKQTLKHTFLTWLYQAPSFSSLSLNALNGLFFLLEKSPFLRDRIPLTSPRKNSITYLPASKAIKTPAADTRPADTIAINKRIEAAGNHVLPLRVLDDFIDQARVHFLMDQCICRSAFKCRNFTSDIGCLFMGDTALKLPPGLGRRVTREAAHQHARRANRAGLVPLTGKVNVDNLGFLI